MTQKLSPAMQAAMWIVYLTETQPHNTPYWPLDARITNRTWHALDKGHGLVDGPYRLTDAGRAWIAEQIEAAHVEALWENLNRALVAEENLNQYPQTERAERMLFLAGVEQVGIMVSSDFVNQDAELAWKMYRFAYNIRNAQSAGHHQQEQRIAMDAGFSLVQLARIARDVQPV